MSISVMNRVWQCSKAAEGQLLVLLAIGDFANDRRGSMAKHSHIGEEIPPF